MDPVPATSKVKLDLFGNTKVKEQDLVIQVAWADLWWALFKSNIGFTFLALHFPSFWTRSPEGQWHCWVPSISHNPTYKVFIFYFSSKIYYQFCFLILKTEDMLKWIGHFIVKWCNACHWSIWISFTNGYPCLIKQFLHEIIR